MKNRFASIYPTILMLGFMPVTAAQAITASVSAHLSQGDSDITQSYDGEATGLGNLFVSTPADSNRNAQASASINGVYAYSWGAGSGIWYPASSANLGGYEVTFTNDSALQNAILANSGQPLEFVAHFQASFTLLNTQNPGGVFNQTTTDASADIYVNGQGFSGGVSGYNGPFDGYGVSASGFVQESNLNSGYFSVIVPFSVDAEHLTTTFGAYTQSNSLSLDLATSSSASILMPSYGDIYLASGQSPSTLSLSYQVSSVPIPAAVWLFGSALAGITFVSKRRTENKLA